jgi:hypothetical protein
MVNQMVQRIQGTIARVPSVARLIDRLLDQIERLSCAVLPPAADNPSYVKARVEARRERLRP